MSLTCLPLFLECKFLSSFPTLICMCSTCLSQFCWFASSLSYFFPFSPFHLLLFKFKELSLEKLNQVMRPHKTPSSAESDLLVINPWELNHCQITKNVVWDNLLILLSISRWDPFFPGVRNSCTALLRFYLSNSGWHVFRKARPKGAYDSLFPLPHFFL